MEIIVLFHLYLGLYSKDFPQLSNFPLPFHVLWKVEVWLRSVSNNGHSPWWTKYNGKTLYGMEPSFYVACHCHFASWSPFWRHVLHIFEGQRAMSTVKWMVFGLLDLVHSEKFPLHQRHLKKTNCWMSDLRMLVGPVAGATPLAHLQNLPHPQSIGMWIIARGCWNVHGSFLKTCCSVLYMQNVSRWWRMICRWCDVFGGILILWTNDYAVSDVLLVMETNQLKLWISLYRKHLHPDHR